MSGFTGVDLSRLPVPDVVEQVDFETVFAAMLADLQARAPEFSALVESDPAFKILQVAAYRETLLREQFNDRVKQVMLAYARGSNLDHLGALVGVGRLLLDPGVPSEGIPPTMESDEDLRRRIQLAPEGFSVAGPEGAYIFHALSADGDVLDASATSPTAGSVVVSIMSRTGNGAASPALVAAVQAVLAADNVRPLTDFVTVQSASIVNYAVNATIYTYSGPDSAVVLAEARARLDRYVEESHRIGRDVTMSGIYSALHIDGVQRVALTSPTSNIAISRTQASYCTGITIADGGVDE